MVGRSFRNANQGVYLRGRPVSLSIWTPCSLGLDDRRPSGDPGEGRPGLGYELVIAP
jgi:hypothetical protein